MAGAHCFCEGTHVGLVSRHPEGSHGFWWYHDARPGGCGNTLMHTVGGDRGQTCRPGGVRARVHARARACVGVCCARAGAGDNVGLSCR